MDEKMLNTLICNYLEEVKSPLASKARKSLSKVDLPEGTPSLSQIFKDQMSSLSQKSSKDSSKPSKKAKVNGTDKPKQNGKSKAESSSEESSSDEESPKKTQVKSPAQKKPAAKPAKESSSEESSSDEEEPPKKSQTKATTPAQKKPAAKPAKESSSEESSSDEEEPPKKSQTKATTPAQKKPAAKPAKESSSEESSSDEDEPPKKSQKKVTTPAQKKPAKESSSEDSSSDEDEASKKPETKAKAQKKTVTKPAKESSEDSSSDEETPAKKATPKAAAKKSKESSDEESSSDESEEKPKVASPKKPERGQKRQREDDEAPPQKKSKFGEESCEETSEIFMTGTRDMEEDTLQEYFSNYKGFETVRLARDKESNTSRGFGFMKFTSVEAAKNVLADGFSHNIHGVNVTLRFSQPKGDTRKSGNEGGRRSGNFEQNNGSEESNEIFIQNVGSLDEDQIGNHFGQFGNIEKCKVARDRETGESRGFAFVTYSTPDEASKAAKETGGYAEIDGQEVTCRIARPSNNDSTPSHKTTVAELPGSMNRRESFRRVREEDVEVDPRFNNSYEAKKGSADDWGTKAHRDLKIVKGKRFTHEKNKKKRGSYSGGKIDCAVNSIRFED